jgi:AraC family transcriptional regulator
MQVLPAGEFFGRRVAHLQCDGFSVSETAYPEYTTLPWHSHGERYLTFVLSGGYRERLRGTTRDCGADSVVIHPAGEDHEDRFLDRRTRCLNVVISSDFAHRAAPAMTSFNRSSLVTGRSASAAGHRFSRELRRADDISPIVMEAVILEFVSDMARSEPNAPRTSAWLREVESIVRRRFSEKLTLREIAAAVGVHRVSLAREFRHHFGVTIGERIRELRVNEARCRIAAGHPLADVAAATGFADQSHFSRTFLRATGITPSQFRKRLR